MLKPLTGVLCAPALASVTTAALAQPAFPTKPIRIIVAKYATIVKQAGIRIQ